MKISRRRFSVGALAALIAPSSLEAATIPRPITVQAPKHGGFGRLILGHAGLGLVHSNN
jgi:hypothetical protein